MTDWLTLDELATYLKRGRSTLYAMAKRGEIPASKIGRTWRFDREEIDTWLRRQSVRRVSKKTKGQPKRPSKRKSK